MRELDKLFKKNIVINKEPVETKPKGFLNTLVDKITQSSATKPNLVSKIGSEVYSALPTQPKTRIGETTRPLLDFLFKEQDVDYRIPFSQKITPLQTTPAKAVIAEGVTRIPEDVAVSFAKVAEWANKEKSLKVPGILKPRAIERDSIRPDGTFRPVVDPLYIQEIQNKVDNGEISKVEGLMLQYAEPVFTALDLTLIGGVTESLGRSVSKKLGGELTQSFSKLGIPTTQTTKEQIVNGITETNRRLFNEWDAIQQRASRGENVSFAVQEHQRNRKEYLEAVADIWKKTNAGKDFKEINKVEQAIKDFFETVAVKDVRDIGRDIDIKAIAQQFSNRAGLPGTRPRPGQAPAFGLSAREMEDVGKAPKSMKQQQEPASPKTPGQIQPVSPQDMRLSRSQKISSLSKNVKQNISKVKAYKGEKDITTSIQKAKASGQSFDEWVKKNAGKRLFHGSKVSDIIEKEGFKLMPDRGVSAFGDGIYFSTKKSDAGGYTVKGGIVESYIPDDLKLYEISSTKPFEVDTKKLISDGYDGVKVNMPGGGENITVFDPSKIKTRSQLKAEWDGVEVPITKEMGQAPVEAFGMFAGFEEDEEGNVQFDPIKAALGVAGAGTLRNVPAVIQGEGFTLGRSKLTQPTKKQMRTALLQEIKATKQEIKNAEIAKKKADKLEAKEQKVRQDTIENLNRYRGPVDTIKNQLENRFLSKEDIDNIILEDGTKLIDAVKVKRNQDKSLSTVITKEEIEKIKQNYTDEIPKDKWRKRSMLVEGIEIPVKGALSMELPYRFFERKGLNSLYEPIIQAGRDAEVMKTDFLDRFKEAGLLKEGGWFTADRFTLPKKEADEIGKYYLTRQGKGYNTSFEDLSPKGKQFVEIFDNIIKETEKRFYETAEMLGKKPGVVENYAPIATRKDIELAEQVGSQEWLFKTHPSFSATKERVENVPKELYETDYREIATHWINGITDFLNYSEPTNHLKYLIQSDEFAKIVKESDRQVIESWLKDITTPESPKGLGGQSINALSRFLRKTVATGSLGLNYASIIKQALTQIPLSIIEKAPPKIKSEYAKAFNIDVSKLPALTKRRGDIAIQDAQSKLARIFTGPLTAFDKINAQKSLNALLDKNYKEVLKANAGAEISPELQRLIEKKAQDTLDMWYGGFFKGQRPEAFRKELGNFILMFLYPMTSQLNGFFRHIAKAKGIKKWKNVAEVLTSVAIIAYLEQVIENLSVEWSDEKQMTEDVLKSMFSNIPLLGNIIYAIENEKELQVSPALSNVTNLMRNIGKGEGDKIIWGGLETLGLPKQIRKIREGLQIMEDGGITDDNGKMLAPVEGTMEIMRSILRGKYGSLAAKDWVRNIGVTSSERRWFVPQVEFLQNGDYERKAELYKTFTKQEQKELKSYLSESQQEKLDKALGETQKSSKSQLQKLLGK